MPRISNHEPFGTSGARRGWTPMDDQSPEEIWAEEHAKCTCCDETFHVDELEHGQCAFCLAYVEDKQPALKVAA